MNGADSRPILDMALAMMLEHTEEFRRLDAAIGDGDLGVTVSDGSTAVRAALGAMPTDASCADVAREAGQAFAKANPSTFSALIGMSVMRASSSLGDDPVGPESMAAFARECSETLATKGKSELGDKTILDALVPAVDALDLGLADGHEPSQTLDLMIDAARQGIEETTPLESKRGRARWLGERTRGHEDPGAVVLLRFLEALREAWSHPRDGTPSPSVDTDEAGRVSQP